MNPGAHFLPDFGRYVAGDAPTPREAILSHKVVEDNAAARVHLQRLIGGTRGASVDAGCAFGRALFLYGWLIIIKFSIDDEGDNGNERPYSNSKGILSIFC